IHVTRREKLTRTTERSHLIVYRSNTNIYVQLMYNNNGVTLTSASSIDKELSLDETSNVDASQKVGELISKRGTDKGIKSVVFDRGGYLYHGRVKALAEAAREAGLEF